MKTNIRQILLTTFCTVASVAGMAAVLDSYPVREGEPDDTARIQRAIDANPSGVLSIPPGTYRISSMLKVYNLCSIEMDKNAILRAVIISAS